MSHTPGDWIYRKGDEWSHSIVTQHGDLPDGSPAYWTVASVNNNRDEKEANARLISAAPELLDVLKALEPYLDSIVCYASTIAEHEPNRLVKLAQDAIAKATGK